MSELLQDRPLQTEDDIQLTTFHADRSGSDEALVINAALALSHQNKGDVFTHEIADEVIACSWETRKFGSKKVPSKPKNVGRVTHRLGHLGNELTLDQATKMRLHEISSSLLRSGFDPGE